MERVVSDVRTLYSSTPSSLIRVSASWEVQSKWLLLLHLVAAGEIFLVNPCRSCLAGS